MSEFKINYQCNNCDKVNVKLWREYNTFANRTKLLCANCLIADQKLDINIDTDGYHIDPDDGRRRCAVNYFVPAIPDEEMEAYWGYTSVPDNLVTWWKQLPR